MPIDIRSSTLKLKYANEGKMALVTGYHFGKGISESINAVANEYLYEPEILESKPDKGFSDYVEEKCGVHGSRQKQLIANEISSMVRSLRNKIAKIPQGTNKKYQREILNKFNSKTLEVQFGERFYLDSRFVDIQRRKNSNGKFEYWIKFLFSYSRDELRNNPELVRSVLIPFRETSHMRSLERRGYSLKTDTLTLHSDGTIQLVYKRQFKYVTSGTKLGVDVGINKALVTSDNFFLYAKYYLERISRCKDKSKGKSRAIRAYKQFLDYAIRHGIDLSKHKEVVMEDLTNIKSGKRRGQKYHHWGHRYIQFRLQLFATEKDVRSRYVYPAYTSQTCSCCGHVDDKSREGEKFSCTSTACGMEMDADLNASINISKK